MVHSQHAEHGRQQAGKPEGQGAQAHRRLPGTRVKMRLRVFELESIPQESPGVPDRGGKHLLDVDQTHRRGPAEEELPRGHKDCDDHCLVWNHNPEISCGANDGSDNLDDRVRFTLTKSQTDEANQSPHQQRGNQGFLPANGLKGPDAQQMRWDFRDPEQELDQEDAQPKFSHAQSQVEVAERR